jgi:hypothetical protein
MSEPIDDRGVLATAERLLRAREHVGADELLTSLGWAADRKLPLMRTIRRLIEDDQLLGKVLSGDATIVDVTVTGITEKGLIRLGL